MDTAAAVAGSKLAVLYCKDGGRAPPFYSSTKSLAVERGTAARNLALFHDIPTGHTEAMLAPPPPPGGAAFPLRVGLTVWYIFAALGASLVLPLWIATSQEGLTMKALGLVYKQPDGSDAEFHVLFCFATSLASSLLFYLYPLFYNILPPLVTSCSVWPAYPLVAFSFLLITPLVVLVHSYRDLLANLPWVSRTCTMFRERFVGVNCAGIISAIQATITWQLSWHRHPRNSSIVDNPATTSEQAPLHLENFLGASCEFPLVPATALSPALAASAGLTTCQVDQRTSQAAL